MMFDMLLDMTIGMILGMAASPLMMKVIKTIRQKRRISKMLNEISELKKNGELDNIKKYQVL
jgi:uncharacterized protein YjgD (DUF1641 family)